MIIDIFRSKALLPWHQFHCVLLISIRACYVIDLNKIYATREICLHQEGKLPDLLYFRKRLGIKECTLRGMHTASSLSIFCSKIRGEERYTND